ncbi:uncharacterized protein LOC124819014 [Hydra vulgaris]|uniref:uncharacterized protein LOC124819014 n=1 Tax=Hydra vulgaris TaxID=6087 RepID=UPI001F5EBDA9|nr:uncharacterized protein LOC124819014 [Hydra vulgaris]
MPRGPTLSEEEKSKIEDYWSLHLSNRAIACKLRRSHLINSFVNDPSNYCTKYQSGRKPILTAHQQRQIAHASSNRTISARQIGTDLGLKCSRWMVNPVINKSGFLRYAKKRTSPALTEALKCICLEWAKDHITWEIQWQKIVWSHKKNSILMVQMVLITSGMT